MHFPTIIGTLTAVAMIAVPASAAPATSEVPSALQKRDGCYGSGLYYADITSNSDELARVREDACHYFAGSYPGNGERKWCKQYDGKKINMSIKNWAKRVEALTFDECKAGFTIEMNACSRGSYQRHGNFYYDNDPNAGNCP
ncbi:hypothetical protein Dda_6018 [Drechslerella dactyloides]|uniref:Secreted protein n=1 Tax=Drechslerella dactyloides TaxID=74499 RepID=A0AAD6NGV4_DREDA|nr:hypothetical protein Dda_6018 [Drechslerella dactyloides]